MLTWLKQRLCSHRYDLADLSPRDAAGMVRCRCHKCGAIHAADCGLHLPGSFDRNSDARVAPSDTFGACLPNGVMFDYLGNPRKRYTRVSLDGAHLILDDVQLADFKASEGDPDQYTYTDAFLSQEEADGLPEFDGF